MLGVGSTSSNISVGFKEDCKTHFDTTELTTMAGTVRIPPGGTWFDTHKTSFVDVPVDPEDQGIATSEFLEAAESTTTLFGTRR